MTRTRLALSAAVLTPLPALVTPAAARETYLVANPTNAWGEIQGATAPLPHPALFFPLDLTGTFSSVKGLAVDGNNAYVLHSHGAGITPTQALLTYDLAAGTRTATTPIPLPGFPAQERGLQDIAVINGSVYGAWADNVRNVRIRRVNPDGTLSDVFSATATNASPSVRLAASSRANSVVLVASQIIPANGGQHFLINPTNWSVTETVTTSSGTTGIAVALDLNGQRLTSNHGAFNLTNAQTVRSVPGFAAQSSGVTQNYIGRSWEAFPPTTTNPATAMSDAFDHPYPSSLPAVVELNPLFYIEGDPETRVLLRRPGASVSLPLRITNFATPDDTALDQVVATHIAWNQLAGATPVQVTATPSPAGDLSVRQIAQATFTLPAGAAPQRGVYALTPDVTLQARHTTGDQQSTRSLHVYNPTRYYFAVDPPSDNLIGNGNFDLGEYGWDGGVATTALWLPTAVASQRVAGQHLELGTPDAPLRLSFDYNADPSSFSDLYVRLDGITLATLTSVTNTTGFQHFTIDIDDPRLRNLTNPLFEFEAVRTSGASNPFVYLDNASLVAIPEPASLTLLIPATLLLRRRR